MEISWPIDVPLNSGEVARVYGSMHDHNGAGRQQDVTVHGSGARYTEVIAVFPYNGKGLESAELIAAIAAVLNGATSPVGLLKVGEDGSCNGATIAAQQAPSANGDFNCEDCGAICNARAMICLNCGAPCYRLVSSTQPQTEQDGGEVAKYWYNASPAYRQQAYYLPLSIGLTAPKNTKQDGGEVGAACLIADYNYARSIGALVVLNSNLAAQSEQDGDYAGRWANSTAQPYSGEDGGEDVDPNIARYDTALALINVLSDMISLDQQAAQPQTEQAPSAQQDSRCFRCGCGPLFPIKSTAGDYLYCEDCGAQQYGAQSEQAPSAQQDGGATSPDWYTESDRQLVTELFGGLPRIQTGAQQDGATSPICHYCYMCILGGAVTGEDGYTYHTEHMPTSPGGLPKIAPPSASNLAGYTARIAAELKQDQEDGGLLSINWAALGACWAAICNVRQWVISELTLDGGAVLRVVTIY